MGKAEITNCISSEQKFKSHFSLMKCSSESFFGLIEEIIPHFVLKTQLPIKSTDCVEVIHPVDKNPIGYSMQFLDQPFRVSRQYRSDKDKCIDSCGVYFPQHSQAVSDRRCPGFKPPRYAVVIRRNGDSTSIS
jgi:hypothetical protein